MSFSRLNTHVETSVYAPIKVLETGRLQTKQWEQRKTYLTCVECVSCVDATAIAKHLKTTSNFDSGRIFFPFLCASTIEMLKLNRRNKNRAGAGLGAVGHMLVKQLS